MPVLLESLLTGLPLSDFVLSYSVVNTAATETLSGHEEDSGHQVIMRLGAHTLPSHGDLAGLLLVTRHGGSRAIPGLGLGSHGSPQRRFPGAWP